MDQSKIKTVKYIFLQTVLMQLIVLAVIGFTCFVAYFGVSKYNSGILWLLGTVAFIVMEFSLICVSVFVKGYGVSFFARSRGTFHGSLPADAAARTRIEYSYGRKSVLTGRRSIIVTEKKETGGGCLLILGLPAIIIGLTGMIKFVIESVRVILSEQRQATWDESRAYLTEQIEAEGKRKFFQTPRTCAFLMGILLVVCIPVTIGIASYYSPRHIEIEFTEKENLTDRYGNASIYYKGNVTNKGSAKVEDIEGILHFKTKDGNILLSKPWGFHAPHQIPSPPDKHLEKDESWDFAFELILSPDDENALVLWNAELNDLEMIFEVRSVGYKTNGSVAFSNRYIEITAGKN